MSVVYDTFLGNKAFSTLLIYIATLDLSGGRVSSVICVRYLNKIIPNPCLCLILLLGYLNGEQGSPFTHISASV